MSKCYSCLEDRILKNNYCNACIKDLFNGIVPKKLDFDRKEFNQNRIKLVNSMSLSGVQDKISLVFVNKELKPTNVNGKFILKPIPKHDDEIKNDKDIIYNEHVSMLISKKIFKINTASCGIISFSDGENAYITKRFDYDNEMKTKYDQEDFASVLGITSVTHGPSYKYDAKNYVDCGNAIKNRVSASIPALEDFFKRIVLNYLISNGDAHLKNFSLYRKEDANDHLLCPNYDILNTRYHVDDSYTALDLFEEYTPAHDSFGYPTFYDFKLLAKYLDINEIRFKKIIAIVAKSEEKVIELVNKSFLSQEAQEAYTTSYKERLKMFFYEIKENQT